MPGFDALGRLALGQLGSSVNTVLTAAAGSYTITGRAIGEVVTEPEVSGVYTVTGVAAFHSLVMGAISGSYVITGANSQLVRTGGDYDQVYGGIGHYLEEIERQKQLAKITRKTPAPIVQQSIPFPQPLAAPQVAQPQPVIDLQAIQQQRMAEGQAQAEQARILKRRQAIEILLLAS